MTQEEFDRLGLMLRPSEARAVLNCDREELKKVREAMKEAGDPIATKLPGGKEWRYYKGRIAELARLKYR